MVEGLCAWPALPSPFLANNSPVSHPHPLKHLFPPISCCWYGLDPDRSESSSFPDDGIRFCAAVGACDWGGRSVLEAHRGTDLGLPAGLGGGTQSRPSLSLRRVEEQAALVSLSRRLDSCDGLGTLCQPFRSYNVFFRRCDSWTAGLGGDSGADGPGGCSVVRIEVVIWEVSSRCFGGSRQVIVLLTVRCFEALFVIAICTSGKSSKEKSSCESIIPDLAWQYQSFFWAVEHIHGGVNRDVCKSFFCMLGTRQADEHHEDIASFPFGLIHQWQMREPLSLIPRSNGRDIIKLGSVKHLPDLQLNFFKPHVQKPARLPGESSALRLASTEEVLEDFSRGCASAFSTDPPSDSGCNLPRLLVVPRLYCNQTMQRDNCIFSDVENFVTPFVCF